MTKQPDCELTGRDFDPAGAADTSDTLITPEGSPKMRGMELREDLDWS